MELVYLWIEEYKNIKKQGFNFSPRFECEFKDEYEKFIDKDGKEKERLKKDCELIINEKKDYVSIFPDNINVTAIIGENGSGKSTLLEEILNIVTSKIMVYIIDNKEIKIKNNSKVLEINSSVHYEIVNNKLDINERSIYLNSDVLKINNVRNHTEFYNKGTFFRNIYFNLFKDEDKDKKNKLDLDNYTKELKLIILKNFNELKNRVFSFKTKKIRLEFKKDNINLIETEFEKEYLEKISAKKDLFRVFDIDNFISSFYNEGILRELVFKNLIFIDLIDERGRNLYDLSQGERKLFTDFIFINNAIHLDEHILMFDEPDFTLHPNWQKKYFNELIRLLSNYKNKKFHIIITSHSPFILSDLPKDNVIFLEKGKQVYPFENNQQTFGANIHTLLSHGFFMKDGLMGEFAKDKIQNVINYHNDIKEKKITETIKQEYKEILQKQYWQIQSIIGDDYLKQVIKNHLIEIEKIVLGNDEANKEEVIRLKAQIELLEK